MLKKTLVLVTITTLMFSCNTSKKAASGNSKKSDKDFKPYSEVITAKAKTDSGMFKTHRVDDKLYFEIPTEQFGKDMLLVSRIAKAPSGYGGGYVNAGSKVNEQVIRFVKRNKKVDLKVISFTNQSDEGSPIQKSVEANNFAPILFSSEIKSYTPDSSAVVIEVDKLFESEVKAIDGMNASFKKRYKVKGLDKSRSYIESVKSYPKNIEVKHVMTYKAQKPPKSNQAGTITMLMNQSLVLLPKNKMQPRIADPRVGWFTEKKYNYNSDQLKSDDYRILKRWRLVPKDMEAYKRGELVEPTEPIVYYLDPATPKKWRPYFKQGIEDWNKAFEKAGFKNAVIAKDAPTKEEDPEFSPEDVRYSVVRYVANTTRNAVGPSVADPRTGEIIESDIMWYHNHLRSYRNRLIIEAGAQNPAVRTLETPEKIIGETMRRVISHEVGHSLGLPHNMKASSAYPVDSLRSASFTQKYGIAATIMDYARINYVAQPEDEGVRYIRKLGPYDLYSINWGYRYIPKANTAKAEKETLDNWILDKADDPMYQFGSGYDGVDPDSQRESLGKDAVKASTYGLQNLKKVVPNLVDWTAQKGQDFDELNEVYSELTYIWRGYIFHVIRNIGGVYKTRKTADQKGVVYKPVPAKMQKKALKFLNEKAFETPKWLLNEKLLNRIESSGAIKRVQNLQTRALNYVLSESRLKRMIENEQMNGNSVYTAVEMLNDLRKGVFSELYNRKKVDAYRRNLQRSYVDAATQYVKKLKSGKDDDLLKSDVIALMRGELEHLKTELKRRGQSNNALTNYHWKDLLARIEAGLKTEN